jgi:hypothetical protein
MDTTELNVFLYTRKIGNLEASTNFGDYHVYQDLGRLILLSNRPRLSNNVIPTLYWMLECTGCRTRRVVHDCYLVHVPTSNDEEPEEGDGYGGPPLPERYSCTKGCTAPMRAIGSISNPMDRTMWLHEPHKPIEMSQHQLNEWFRLIQEAGLE